MIDQAARRDERGEVRQDVLYRTRGQSALGMRPITVVNISPAGLMARTNDAHAPGDRLTVQLPAIGPVAAEVRWALGGRIGCRLERLIPLTDYEQVLRVMQAG